jgi:hypothetical protein
MASRVAAERGKILEMVAAGQLTAVEAAELLKSVAMATSAPETGAPASGGTAPSPERTQAKAGAASPLAASEVDKVKRGTERSARWLRIRVSNLETGKSKVAVNVPLGMLKFGLRLGHRFAPELKGFDWNELDGLIAASEEGVLVDVADEEGGDHVQIYID